MLIVVVLCVVASLWTVIVPPFRDVELSEKISQKIELVILFFDRPKETHEIAAK